MSDVLYLKIEQNTQVSKTDVTLKDIAKLECAKTEIANRLKTEKLFTIHPEKSTRYIISVLQVVEWIHDIYPTLEIQNLGEIDFLVEYEPKQKKKPGTEILKIFSVLVLIFFGSAFSMMAFNEDVGTLDIFDKIYSWVMGHSPGGPTVLEFTYALGLTGGIIIFFNHMGGNHLTKDPTPIEVEMRQYEQQVNTTVIQNVGRKGKEIDVD